MLSEPPNSILICQLTQRAMLDFPMLCEKNPCNPVTKCSIHTEITVLLSWKNSEKREIASVSCVCHAME